MKKKVFGFLVVLVILSPFFFFILQNLGYKSLESFDEALYATLARNILKSGNFLELRYNGEPFADHPPGSVWFMSLAFGIFGVNEFSARIYSALSGVVALLLLYAIGAKLFSKKVGLSAALMLGSSLWFIMRARSGNFDIPFIGWSLISIYLFLWIEKKSWVLYGFFVAFALTLLSKTLVGFAYIPLFLILFYEKRNFLKKRKLALFNGVIIFLMILLPWYFKNLDDFAQFKHHFLTVGLREKEGFHWSLSGTSKLLLYLRSGIGKWYKLVLIFVPISGFLAFWGRGKWRYGFKMVGLWLFFFLPLFLTPKTQIWHLLPIYPPILLLTCAGMFWFASRIMEKITNFWKLPQQKRKIIEGGSAFLLLGAILLISLFQLRQVVKLVIPATKTISDKADISLHAKESEKPLLLKEVFLPVAIFYADKYVHSFGFMPNAFQDMETILQNNSDAQFIIIHGDYKTLIEKEIPVKKVYENWGYVLVENI